MMVLKECFSQAISVGDSTLQLGSNKCNHNVRWQHTYRITQAYFNLGLEVTVHLIVSKLLNRNEMAAWTVPLRQNFPIVKLGFRIV